MGRDDPIPRGESGGNRDDIRREIEKMMKERDGTLTQNDYSALYNRFRNNADLVDEILHASAKRNMKIRKEARRVARKINERYNTSDRPMHEILKSLAGWKKRNDWTDEQFDTFYRELTAILSGNRAREIDYNQNIISNRSRINRALGNQLNTQVSGLNMADEDHKYLDEIIRLFEENIDLYQDVCMHSLMYRDCSFAAMTGEFKSDKHVASRHIHPIFACMFLPKIEYLETRMLRSNMGAIVKARKDRQMVQTESDYKLYSDMISDPNDVVCDLDSPFADIRNRYRVQIALWELVLLLRSGNYYGSHSGDVMNRLNMCRNNLYDNADLSFHRDEGSTMRRLMSVFSCRPLFITTRPVVSFGAAGLAIPALGSGIMSGRSGLGHIPFREAPSYTVTAIPMINVSIPSSFEAESRAVDLRNSTRETMWLTHHGQIQPREQTLVSVNGVLIFYANRRMPSIQIRSATMPVPFHQLPISVSGFERINSHPINCPNYISLASGEDFQLRSVVAVSQTQLGDSNTVESIITGCTGLIISNTDLTAAQTGLSMNLESNHYLYDPFGASIPIERAEGDGYFANRPVTVLDPHFGRPNADGTPADPSWYERATRSGTIYIYSRVGGEMPRGMPISI